MGCARQVDCYANHRINAPKVVFIIAVFLTSSVLDHGAVRFKVQVRTVHAKYRSASPCIDEKVRNIALILISDNQVMIDIRRVEVWRVVVEGLLYVFGGQEAVLLDFAVRIRC